jgi:hypothetical protein
VVVEFELQPARNENIVAEANRSDKILRISCLLDVREDVRQLVKRPTPTCIGLRVKAIFLWLDSGHTPSGAIAALKGRGKEVTGKSPPCYLALTV